MGRKTNREVWFLAQTHWYIRRNPITWSNEVFTFQRLFVIKGENKRDLTCGFGRSTRQAHHKGRQGHEEASGSTFGRKFQSQVGPECQGQRTVFLCVFVFTCIYVYFSYVFFCFTFCVQIGHERAKASRLCIMPRIERPLWGKPISGYNATQPDALIEISHSRLGRLCQMYS